VTFIFALALYKYTCLLTSLLTRVIAERRRITSLIETSVLPLSQAATLVL